MSAPVTGVLTKPYFTENSEKFMRMLVEIYDISQTGAERVRSAI